MGLQRVDSVHDPADFHWIFDSGWLLLTDVPLGSTIILAAFFVLGVYLTVHPVKGICIVRSLVRISDGWSAGRFLSSPRGVRVFGIGMAIVSGVPLALALLQFVR